MRRFIVVLLAALGIASGAPGLAFAEPYPPVVPGEVSAAVITAGQTVTFTAQGFAPNELITITVTNTGSAAGAAPMTFQTTASATGTVSYTIPLTKPGTYLIVAQGAISGSTASATVSVQAAAPVVATTAAAQMPVTGTDGHLLTTQVVTALIAIALGAGLLFLVVRRRQRGRQA
jgi:hypothetical protein